MRRAPYVIAGTVAGIVGVLSFPTHRARLVIPTSQPATTTPGTTPTAPVPTAPTAPVGDQTTPGAAPTTAPAPTTPTSSASGLRHTNGTDQQYPYGVLSVTVTVDGSRITDVAIASISETDNRSVQIDAQAIPLLRRQVLAAQATSIDGVSGATYTSQAYVDSVQSALDQLGVK